jgi:DNA-binding transcriptional LysR family regulator
MKQMVRQNLGVAMVSALSCRDEVASGTLAARSLPGLTTRRTIYLVHRRHVALTRAAEAFVQVLLETVDHC